MYRMSTYRPSSVLPKLNLYDVVGAVAFHVLSWYLLVAVFYYEALNYYSHAGVP